MKKYIMALDQGTTSSRCILFDQDGRICSMAQKEFPQYFPKTGWVEHDPMEIWSSQLSVTMEAVSKIGADFSQIEAIGITNQRETTIVWDRTTGKPVSNAIVWQCRRTAAMIDQLCTGEMAEYIRRTTGLIPDAYFSGSKIAWILNHTEGAREKAKKGELLFGTVETWLIWNLTKGAVHVTDYTNASRTMLFDIHHLRWDEKLLELFDIPKEMLPEVKPSSCIYGYTDTAILGAEIPIAGAAGDQQAALFGQCCFTEGDLKNTYGTGCFLLMNTGTNPAVSSNGLLTTILAGTDEHVQYALEGSVFTAGAAIQWLRDELKILDNAQQSEEYCRMVPDSGGVYVIPAFTGLGAPYWDPYARGTITGITRGTTRAHLVRATVEALAYQVSDVIQAMEKDAGIRLRSLKVDGGASSNDFLLQFQADLLDVSVKRPECIETTALGAAYLAGLACGFWNGKEELQDKWLLESEFQAEIAEEKRQKLLHGWKKAVNRSFAWAKNEE